MIQNKAMGTDRELRTSRSDVATWRIFAKQELAAFAQFVRHPVRRPLGLRKADKQWQRIAFFFGLILAFNIAFILTIGLALDAWTSVKYERDLSSVGTLFAVVVLAPVLEECLFRAKLRSFPYTLWVGPVIASCFTNQLVISIVMALIFTCVGLHFQWKVAKQEQQGVVGLRFQLARHYLGVYPWVFWFYAWSFSFAHIANFSFNDASGFFVLFAVLPQLFIGTIAAYLRLRDGLKSAIAVHFLNNALTVAIIVLSDYV